MRSSLSDSEQHVTMSEKRRWGDGLAITSLRLPISWRKPCHPPVEKLFQHQMEDWMNVVFLFFFVFFLHQFDWTFSPSFSWFPLWCLLQARSRLLAPTATSVLLRSVSWSLIAGCTTERRSLTPVSAAASSSLPRPTTKYTSGTLLLLLVSLLFTCSIQTPEQLHFLFFVQFK